MHLWLKRLRTCSQRGLPGWLLPIDDTDQTRRLTGQLLKA
jgi:hypothetical protein